MFKHINTVIRILVVADFFYNAAFGSLAPVFAIFIVGNVVGGSASVAGYAVAIYWLVRSLFQLPIARWLDRTDGERDDFWAMCVGYLLSSTIPFGYIFATEPWHLYALQGALGFFIAWAAPGWYSIFTRHVDKWRMSFEWSLESVFGLGLSAALSAALGGYIFDTFGFKVLFVGVGTLAFIASLILLGARSRIVSKKESPARMLPNRRGLFHHGS